MKIFSLVKQYRFFSSVLAISILLALGLGIFLYFSLLPANVKYVAVTNVTDSAASIVWVTDKPSIGRVLVRAVPFDGVGSVESGAESFSDDRDVEETEAGIYSLKGAGESKYYVHHVTVRNLNPVSNYYFSILNDGKVFLPANNSFATSKSLDNISSPDPVYGRVFQKDKNPVADGVMIINLIGDDGLKSQKRSSYISNGTYTIDLSGMLMEGGVDLFVQNDNTADEFLAFGLTGAAVGKVSGIAPGDTDKPIVDLELTDESFANADYGSGAMAVDMVEFDYSKFVSVAKAATTTWCCKSQWGQESCESTPATIKLFTDTYKSGAMTMWCSENAKAKGWGTCTSCYPKGASTNPVQSVPAGSNSGTTNEYGATWCRDNKRITNTDGKYYDTCVGNVKIYKCSQLNFNPNAAVSVSNCPCTTGLNTDDKCTPPVTAAKVPANTNPSTSTTTQRGTYYDFCNNCQTGGCVIGSSGKKFYFNTCFTGSNNFLVNCGKDSNGNDTTTCQNPTPVCKGMGAGYDDKCVASASGGGQPAPEPATGTVDAVSFCNSLPNRKVDTCYPLENTVGIRSSKIAYCSKSSPYMRDCTCIRSIGGKDDVCMDPNPARPVPDNSNDESIKKMSDLNIVFSSPGKYCSESKTITVPDKQDYVQTIGDLYECTDSYTCKLIEDCATTCDVAKANKEDRCTPPVNYCKGQQNGIICVKVDSEIWQFDCINSKVGVKKDCRGITCSFGTGCDPSASAAATQEVLNCTEVDNIKTLRECIAKNENVITLKAGAEIKAVSNDPDGFAGGGSGCIGITNKENISINGSGATVSCTSSNGGTSELGIVMGLDNFREDFLGSSLTK